MSNLDEERKAIQTRFDTAWGAGPYATISVAYENVDFDPPVNAAYVALYIRPGSGDQISLGSGEQWSRYIGVILFSIYVPANSGQKQANDIAEFIALIFQKQQFTAGAKSSIVCDIPSITVIGKEANLFRTDLSIPFQRDTLE